MENCRKCRIELVIGENWMVSCKNHSIYLCQKCLRDKVREWTKTHKVNTNRAKRKYFMKLRLEVLTHYGGNPPKCACCGETIIQFLTIDHINNDGAEHRKQISGSSRKCSGHHMYQWLKKNNYPNEFQVLCMNCNFGKRMNDGICPHGMIK
jgi:hypothetical protein